MSARAPARLRGDGSPLLDPGPDVDLEGLGRHRTVSWGQPWQVGTAAHWVALTKYEALERSATAPNGRQLGATLREEVAACILGGFGMPFETGLAAFHEVRESGLLADGSTPTAADLETILRRPLLVGASARAYRFPAQRALRLAAAMTFLGAAPPPDQPVMVRDWLTRIPGVGPKTASWIVRNHFGSHDVAVVDVHILRAGIAARVFEPGWLPHKDYPILEAFFLAWAQHGKVLAGDLDAVIWSEQATRARFSRRATRRGVQTLFPMVR